MYVLLFLLSKSIIMPVIYDNIRILSHHKIVALELVAAEAGQVLASMSAVISQIKQVSFKP